MPAPLHYAIKFSKLLAKARKSGEGEAIKLGPDAKSQVTLRYIDGKPVEATQIVLSTQHVDEDLTSDDMRRDRRALYRARPACRAGSPARPSGMSIPPANSSSADPMATAGLTGRKIIVDTYGGAAPHGGGAFSGKDPTKVDRSAAYAARYLAKNVVAAGLAER